MDTTFPTIALSVRQPWAWAIVAGFKDIENRGQVAVRKGGMDIGPIAIHASKSMTRDEYKHAAAFMAQLGVACPPPADLVRGGIVGTVTVTSIVARSQSRWFFGPRGLVLRDAKSLAEPIPAKGQLGFFAWSAGGELMAPLPWMTTWTPAGRRGEPSGPAVTAMPLFPHA